jgi:hypothetical protein
MPAKRKHIISCFADRDAPKDQEHLQNLPLVYENFSLFSPPGKNMGTGTRGILLFP